MELRQRKSIPPRKFEIERIEPMLLDETEPARVIWVGLWRRLGESKYELGHTARDRFSSLVYGRWRQIGH